VYQFGSLGKFGRNDDLTFDLSAHAGRDMVYITRGKKPLRRVERFFQSVETEVIREGRLKYRVSILRGFNFDAYRDEVLERLRKAYYFEPKGYPPSGCSFTRLHFGERRCGHERDRNSSQSIAIPHNSSPSIAKVFSIKPYA
jgi:hypothetical protein